MKRKNWAKEELEKLHEHFGEMPTKELRKKYLPNRSEQSISRKASALGIASAKSLDWTEKDIEKLRENYDRMPIKKLQEKYLPNKSENAIKHKASRLGITSKKRPWAKEEDKILRENYGMSTKELQEKLPGKTPQAIESRARKLGIAKKRNPDWTDKEDEILRENYGRMPNKELREKYLPDRPEPAIRMRAHFLGVTSKRISAETNGEQKSTADSANLTATLLSTIHSSTQFSNWLSQNIGLPESSIVAYTNAVDKISKEMLQKGTIQKSLEDMSPFELDYAIALIISDTDFATKNTREKHMYSNALKQYRYFLNTTAEDSGDHAYMEMIENDRQIPETQKEAIIQSRIGQGEFRKSLIDKYNGRCIITGIDHPNLLVASHIKPWAASSNKERLSVDNGLLLSATYDRLFDRGLITFDRYGKILLSSLIGAENIKRLGLSQGMRFNLQINKSMEEYLSYHRKEVFLE